MLELSIVVALILLNGFFALSEMALMTSRKTRLKHMGEHSRGARKALALAEHPDNLLSTVQVGITSIGVLTGVFGGEAIGLAIASYEWMAAATLLIGPAPSYERWHALATSAPGAVLIVIFFAALCGHAWVGVRDIVLDYIQPTALRLPLLALIAFILIAITLRVTLTMATHFTVGA